MTGLDYVERQDGGYRVRGTSVSPDSVLYPFLGGSRPRASRPTASPRSRSGRSAAPSPSTRPTAPRSTSTCAGRMRSSRS